MGSPAGQPRPNLSSNPAWHWPVHAAFIVLLAASLGLMWVVGIQSWQEFHRTPDVRIWVNDGTKTTRDQVGADIKTAFESYRDRVDNLQKLIAALIGLSSLYAVVVAVTGYLNGQAYMKQLSLAGAEFLQETQTKAADAATALADANRKIADAQIQLDQAKKTSDELQSRFNTFRDVNKNLRDLTTSIHRVLPDAGTLLPKYEALSGEHEEQIYFWERSLAFAEVLAGADSADMNELLSGSFIALVRFYRARFRFEATAIGFDVESPRITWTLPQREVFRLVERALMYGQKATERTPASFAAWNELGISRQTAQLNDLAEEALKQSLQVCDNQQKPRFFLSLLRHRSGDYGAAEKLLTEALARTAWETREDADRRADLYYNRACARARLALVSADAPDARQAFEKSALEDLNFGCPRPNKEVLKYFWDDCRFPGDLAQLKMVYPKEIGEIQERLSGSRPFASP